MLSKVSMVFPVITKGKIIKVFFGTKVHWQKQISPYWFIFLNHVSFICTQGSSLSIILVLFVQ